MISRYLKRYRWLNPDHPLTARESRRITQQLPRPLRKLSDFWTLLGYSALVHGIMFSFSLLGYNSILFGAPGIMLPFLTPFGTPLAAAMLHSVIYWAMLIGIVNFNVRAIERDVHSRAWEVLRLTPYSTGSLLNAKFGSTMLVFIRVLKSIFFTRLLALIILPAAIVLQQTGTDAVHPPVTFNILGGLVFMLQPFVDAFLVSGLSAVAAVTMKGESWARIGAYGLVISVYGALSSIGSIFLVLKSPIGLLAGLFAPLPQWAPLAAAVVKPQSSAEFSARMMMVVIVYFVMPLLIGTVAMWTARRLAER